MEPAMLNKKIILDSIEYHPDDLPEFLRKHGEASWVSEIISFILNWWNGTDHISVQTSGSTGIPKQIRLSKKMMAASARLTCRYLDIKPGDKALLCLPVQFIAGKMMIVRAIIQGLNLYCVEPSSTPEIVRKYDFCAMTPHQVIRLLETGNEKLNKLSKLIIGGGSLDKKVADQLQELDTRCFLTYGMTETSSHIALQKINGPGKQDHFELIDQDMQIFTEQDGRLCFKGGFTGEEIMRTNDVVKIIDQNHFQWIGRADFVINSGGIKVHPEALENRIRDLIPVPFIVISIPDNVFRERIALVLQAGVFPPEKLYEEICKRVQAHEKPVKIFVTEHLHTTENGKIIRQIDPERDATLIWEKKT